MYRYLLCMTSFLSPAAKESIVFSPLPSHCRARSARPSHDGTSAGVPFPPIASSDLASDHGATQLFGELRRGARAASAPTDSGLRPRPGLVPGTTQEVDNAWRRAGNAASQLHPLTVPNDRSGDRHGDLSQEHALDSARCRHRYCARWSRNNCLDLASQLSSLAQSEGYSTVRADRARRRSNGV